MTLAYHEAISQQSTLHIVAELIATVIGEDFALVGTIALDTSFNEDLELESIEFVALAEQLQRKFGTQVDFVAWLSQKDLDEIIALKVGDLVEFIESCRS